MKYQTKPTHTTTNNCQPRSSNTNNNQPSLNRQTEQPYQSTVPHTHTNEASNHAAIEQSSNRAQSRTQQTCKQNTLKRHTELQSLSPLSLPLSVSFSGMNPSVNDAGFFSACPSDLRIACVNSTVRPSNPTKPHIVRLCACGSRRGPPHLSDRMPPRQTTCPDRRPMPCTSHVGLVRDRDRNDLLPLILDARALALRSTSASLVPST